MSRTPSAVRRAVGAPRCSAAVAAAAHDALVATLDDLPTELFPPESGCAASRHRPRRRRGTPPPWRRIPDGAAKTNGIGVGQAAAAAIVAVRAADHANDAPLVDTAAARRPTRRVPVHAQAHRSPSRRSGERSPRSRCATARQFASGPPYPLTSRRYATDFDEVKRLGGGGDGDPTPSARTAEQTEIALFWVESSPLAWNRMARGIATDRRARRMGGRPSVRSAEHGDGRRLHRNVRREVQLQLLASGDRHPPCGRGRQPAHVARPRLGSPSSGRRRSRTTTPATASKVAWPPR